MMPQLQMSANCISKRHVSRTLRCQDAEHICRSALPARAIMGPLTAKATASKVH